MTKEHRSRTLESGGELQNVGSGAKADLSASAFYCGPWGKLGAYALEFRRFDLLPSSEWFRLGEPN